MLTTPERWDTEFVVIDVARPYGLMAKFIDNLPSGLNVMSTLEPYEEAYVKSGYKMSLERVVSKLWQTKDLITYYKQTRDVDPDKTIISKDELEEVTRAHELILANEFAVKYFFPDKIRQETWSQVIIIFKYKPNIEGVREWLCKAMLDGIFIDHSARTITPYDLKTTVRSALDFKHSYLEYGYYRQAAMYMLALLSEESPIKGLLEEGYTLLPFRFIVAEKKVGASLPAIIYLTTENDIICGTKGGTINGRYYKGIDELIQAYQFHVDNNYWDLPMELYLNKGEVELNIFDDAKEHISNSTSAEPKQLRTIRKAKM